MLRTIGLPKNADLLAGLKHPRVLGRITGMEVATRGPSQSPSIEPTLPRLSLSEPEGLRRYGATMTEVADFLEIKNPKMPRLLTLPEATDLYRVAEQRRLIRNFQTRMYAGTTAVLLPAVIFGTSTQVSLFFLGMGAATFVTVLVGAKSLLSSIGILDVRGPDLTEPGLGGIHFPTANAIGINFTDDDTVDKIRVAHETSHALFAHAVNDLDDWPYSIVSEALAYGVPRWLALNRWGHVEAQRAQDNKRFGNAMCDLLARKAGITLATVFTGERHHEQFVDSEEALDLGAALIMMAEEDFGPGIYRQALAGDFTFLRPYLAG